ncbi:MAG: glycosyltransferase [Phycisphaeraceae bacterium]|nr:glycosyltransferase [Phycisphaeraceae bacterium]
MSQGGCPSNTTAEPAQGSGVTVLIPAYNEAASIADTLRSLAVQTVPPAQIIVVDDCSTDQTGDIARSLGATVYRPPQNTGFKAGAQIFGLQYVNTPYLLAIDADTTLAPNAIEKILTGLDGSDKTAASCGMVLPRYVSTIWERGRYVEYLFAFTFGKAIQNHFYRPMIASGCFTLYRTDVLRQIGAWQPRTVAEDLDLTWTFFQNGYDIAFVEDAVCYPIEPHNYHFLRKQLRRWSHGFFQCMRIHWRTVIEQPYLRSMVAVGMWDALIAAIVYLFVIPMLTVLVHPVFLVAYVIDAPVVAVPVIFGAIRRRELGKALLSLPGFFVLRMVNAIFMLEAAWSELIFRRPLAVFEKGH